MAEGKQVNIKQFDSFVKQVDGWIKHLDKKIDSDNDNIKRLDDLENNSEYLYEDNILLSDRVTKLEGDVDFLKFIIMIMFDKLLSKEMKDEITTKKGLNKTVRNLEDLFRVDNKK